MNIFEVKEKNNMLCLLGNEIYLLLFFNIGLLFGNITFFSNNYLIIELCVFVLLIYSLFNKRNRYVYRLLLNPESKILTIYFYQFVVWKFEQNIQFNSLQVNYRHKLYGRGKIPKTLELKRDNILIAEIKQKYNVGWKNEELENLYEELKKIENEYNNKI